MACRPAASSRYRDLRGFRHPTRSGASRGPGRRPSPPLPPDLAHHPAQRRRRGRVRDPVRPHRAHAGHEQPDRRKVRRLAVLRQGHGHAQPGEQHGQADQKGDDRKRHADAAADAGPGRPACRGAGGEAQQRRGTTPHAGAADHRADPGTVAERGAEHVERNPLRRMTGSGETADGLTFRALGTVVSVLVVDEQAGEAASAILEEELSLVDAACSRFRADSELSQLNRAGGRRIAISQFFANALATALTAAQVTDGDVDPTCGRSLVVIGYDRDYAEVRRDATPLCQPATPAAGWQTVEIDPVLCTARVPDGVMLDLGATAKALAADRAASRIAAAVGCGVLVNLGGDISVAGEPPPGGWCVGVIDDLGADGGLATSSTTVRAWRRGIAAFHHIVAPGTGLPAQSCWRTVSVAAASCVDANTASTASIIRGEQAPAWLNGLRLPARLVRHDGTVVTAGGWPADGRTADGQTADEAPTGRQA